MKALLILFGLLVGCGVETDLPYSTWDGSEHKNCEREAREIIDYRIEGYKEYPYYYLTDIIPTQEVMNVIYPDDYIRRYARNLSPNGYDGVIKREDNPNMNENDDLEVQDGYYYEFYWISGCGCWDVEYSL